ncbi:hypothetical protein J3Q64DRAFT_1728466 [Phycomyces blakesleeanus]|uniref:Uncharacterized protein n=1 Tax=Phycomyces blakesleeanus TaxID=4837 RepID=A0ABR3B4G0_PHYBL
MQYTLIAQFKYVWVTHVILQNIRTPATIGIVLFQTMFLSWKSTSNCATVYPATSFSTSILFFKFSLYFGILF